MSVCFTVELSQPLSHHDFVEAVNLGDLVREGPPVENQDEPLSGVNYFYLEDTSCRGINVSQEKNGYIVTINYPNSWEDWELGLRAVEALAGFSKAPIHVEGNPISVEDFRSTFNKSWISEQFDRGADLMLNQGAALKDGAVSIEGAVRPFYIGPRLAKEIREGRDAPEARSELIEKIRDAQFVGLEYFVPKEYQLANKKKFVVVGPNVQMILPWVQYVALVSDEDQHFYIPYDLFHVIAEDNVSWLDEKQLLIDPIDVSDWPDLVRKTEGHTVDLTDAMKEGIKILITRARVRYDHMMEELDSFEDEVFGDDD